MRTLLDPCHCKLIIWHRARKAVNLAEVYPALQVQNDPHQLAAAGNCLPCAQRNSRSQTRAGLPPSIVVSGSYF